MFFVSYALMNRTLSRWFPRSLEIASEETQKLLNDLGAYVPRLHMLGYQAATAAQPSRRTLSSQHALAAVTGLDAVWVFDRQGKIFSAASTAMTRRESLQTLAA